MNILTLILIILGFWILILQNRVKDLEAMVVSIKNKINSNPMVEVETIGEVETISSESVEPVIQEYSSSVETFKEQYSKESVEPKEPSKLFTFIKNYFTGGNILVRVGGVILFFGLAFLVKYAAEHSIISIELRLGFVAVLAFVLIVLGWRLRAREGAYGQVLQGLGVAMLYLVIYGSAKFYELLSLDMAFLLMLVVVLLGSILAVMENALPLALFSTVGGFLVPILTSSGDGSHIVLFSYFVLLNFGLFAVAWYRSWRVLNLTGFVFTFVIATAWGVLRYEPELFSTTEPFLIIYFLMYLGISILFTVKHPFEPKNLVDGTLVFGLPVIAFPMQVSLVNVYEYGEAYSASILATIYLVLYLLLKAKERTKLLAQSFLALSILFYTIAIPYIFDEDVSAALWSLESAGIICLSIKQNKIYAKYFGEALLLLSIFTYPDSVSSGGISWAEYMGYLIVIVASIVSSYLLDREKKQLYIPKVFLALAIILWFTGTFEQFMRLDIYDGNAIVLSLVLGASVLFIVSKVIKWKMLNQTLQGYMFFGIVVLLLNYEELTHPFKDFGALSFGTFIILNYILLYLYGKEWRAIKYMHTLSLWFVVLTLSLELFYHIDLLNLGSNILTISLIVTPILFSMVILFISKYPNWMDEYRTTYKLVAVGGFVVVLMFWELAVFSMSPDTKLVTYIPILNPLDLAQILVLLAAFYWAYTNSKTITQSIKKPLYSFLAFMTTLLISIIFARAVHMLRDVEYSFVNLWSDIYFQTGLSILWSSVAIVAMLFSKHYLNRSLWIAGFSLLVIIVLKLFFIELASSGTIERIVSFMVVGTLLLLIGYFVPLPPENKLKDYIV